MTSQHFYIENARLMSFGLSRLGTCTTCLGIVGNETIPILAGKLIGLGFHNRRADACAQLLEHTEHENPLIRRSSYMSLAFSGLVESSEGTSSALMGGFVDPDTEARKAALIGFGLANVQASDQSLGQVLDVHLHAADWKVRGAAGLAYAYLSCGNPEHFSKFMDILKRESSPYVKVCSCWYVSSAFAGTGRGEEEYRSLLALAGEDNSFYRDMACLGLGLSYLGTGDRSVSMLLEDMATTDGHPYVRESALFGLALTHFQRPDAQVMQLLTDGLQDDSAIVRSGASLGLGIVAMGTGDLQVDLMEHSDFSVLWGLTISEGLANLAPSQREFRSGYVQWGHNISNGFRDDTQEVFESDHSDVLAFQEEVNAGLIGAGALARRQRDELRLIVPGVFHYLMYDSFWWGLWVLNSLGTTLLAGRD